MPFDDPKQKPQARSAGAGEDAKSPKKTPLVLPHSWWGIGAGFAVVLFALVLALALLTQFLQARPANLRPHTDMLIKTVRDLLAANHIPEQSIQISPAEVRKDSRAYWDFYTVDIVVPETLSRTGVEKLLRNALLKRNIAVAGGLKDSNVGELILLLGDRQFASIRARQAAVMSPPSELPQSPASGKPALSTDLSADPAPASAAPAPPGDEASKAVEPIAPDSTQRSAVDTETGAELLPLDSTGLNEQELKEPHTANGVKPSVQAPFQMAIILDDGGYGGPTTDAVLELDPQLTLAILPNAPHTAETVARAAALGFELMLHMPMEALSPKDNFAGYVSADMTAEQMRAVMDADLSQIPGAVGINNHTGSKFTALEPAMRAFLSNLSGRSLYFVDSHTVGTSVAYKTAKTAQIPCAVNNLFMDNSPDPALIRGQIDKVRDLCLRQGYAITIGHFRPETVLVLKEEIPKLKAAGITLVHASELVH